MLSATRRSVYPTVLEFVVLLVVILFTFHYRNEYAKVMEINKSQQHDLFLLNSSFIQLEGQYRQLQTFYSSTNEPLLNLVETQFKDLVTKLKKVEAIYMLHRNIYDPSDKVKQLTTEQRIIRLENLLEEESKVLDFLENIIKDVISQAKFQKMDGLAKGQYFSAESMRTNWKLLKDNIYSPFTTHQERQQFQQLYRKEQIRLEGIYNLSKYEQELPFCIIVPSYNNVKNFRYEWNIHSILKQNYSNFHVVIIDDHSPDQTGLHIRRYLRRHNISEEKVKLVINKKQYTAVPNLHRAAIEFCGANEIGFYVDGDDQLVGKMAFKIFNAVYQDKSPAVAYSIAFEWWIQDNFVKDNWSQEYTEIEKKNSMYRDVGQKISHLRSFRIDLYRQINEKDLKFPNGQWFTSTYDEVICLPMMEMSCGKIEVIQQYCYLYTYGTGFNDRAVDSSLQLYIARLVKSQYPRYHCDPRFLEKNSINDLLKHKKKSLL